jgi:hypothetical protein
VGSFHCKTGVPRVCTHMLKYVLDCNAFATATQALPTALASSRTLAPLQPITQQQTLAYQFKVLIVTLCYSSLSRQPVLTRWHGQSIRHWCHSRVWNSCLQERDSGRHTPSALMCALLEHPSMWCCLLKSDRHRRE